MSFSSKEGNILVGSLIRSTGIASGLSERIVLCVFAFQLHGLDVIDAGKITLIELFLSSLIGLFATHHDIIHSVLSIKKLVLEFTDM
jgi:hypothetical protein